jgi:hypothetical protein
MFPDGLGEFPGGKIIFPKCQNRHGRNLGNSPNRLGNSPKAAGKLFCSQKNIFNILIFNCMSHDVFPRRESDFYQWIKKMMSDLNAKASEWNLPSGSGGGNGGGGGSGYERKHNTSLSVLNDLVTKYETKYLIAIDPATRTQGAIIAKNEAKDNLEKATRDFLEEHVIYNSAITDEERVNMGLSVHKQGRTPAPVATTHPEADVKTPEPSILEFSVHDESGVNVKKPAGQKEFEIRYGISDTPITNWKNLPEYELSSRLHFRLTFDNNDRGRILYYALRWRNTRGQAGPWSNIHNAIIP